MPPQFPYDDNLLNSPIGDISSYKDSHQLAFRCNICNNWNRSLAVHCTRCGELLNKPQNWAMAQMNNRRTPALRRIVQLPDNYGLDTPLPLASGHQSDEMPEASLPSMLTADSYLIFPNPHTQCLQVQNMVDPDHPKVSEIPFDLQEGSTQTPVFWGKHLYYARSGGIFSASLLDGNQSALHNEHSIEPTPDCTPILAHLMDGEPVIAFGLSTSILLYGPLRRSIVWHVPHNIHTPDQLNAPVYFDGHIVFTTRMGRIFALELATGELREDDHRRCYFSAPVVANAQVCFEVVVHETLDRYVGHYHPNGGAPVYHPLTIEAAQEPAKYPEYPADFLPFPPLSDGARLIFTDKFGRELYLYTVSNFPNKGGVRLLRPTDMEGQITPPRSVIVGGNIYATSHFGLTTYNLNTNRTATDPLLVRGQRDIPIASPICYGDTLFVLCRRHLFSHQLQRRR
jgi:outer membrane protein assembly factor BamB